MNIVYVLLHKNKGGDIKLLGVFLEENSLKERVKTMKELPGFRDVPDGFFIEKYEVDKTYWPEFIHQVHYSL